MKTLYQRQQELERLRSRPFQLAEALANDVRGCCEERRLYARIDANLALAYAFEHERHFLDGRMDEVY
jgi:hypothetical protein